MGGKGAATEHRGEGKECWGGGPIPTCFDDLKKVPQLLRLWCNPNREV